MKLPAHLMETYEEVMANVDGMSLMSNYAVQSALLQAKFKEMGEVPPREAILGAKGQLRRLKDMVSFECDGLPIEIEEEIDAIIRNLDQVLGTQVAEKEARQIMLEQAKIVQAESQRVEKGGKYVTVEQIMALMAAVVTYFNETITNENLRKYTAPTLRERFASKIVRLSSRGSSPRSEP
jgi:hypothetical protein